MNGLFYSRKEQIMCWIDMESFGKDPNDEVRKQFILHFLGFPKETEVHPKKLKNLRKSSRFEGFTYYWFNKVKNNSSASEIGDWSMYNWINC
jgi:hypothetical protein